MVYTAIFLYNTLYINDIISLFNLRGKLSVGDRTQFGPISTRCGKTLVCRTLTD
jgi:hypothetical protein